MILSLKYIKCYLDARLVVVHEARGPMGNIRPGRMHFDMLPPQDHDNDFIIIYISKNISCVCSCVLNDTTQIKNEACNTRVRTPYMVKNLCDIN